MSSIQNILNWAGFISSLVCSLELFGVNTEEDYGSQSTTQQQQQANLQSGEKNPLKWQVCARSPHVSQPVCEDAGRCFQEC